MSKVNIGFDKKMVEKTHNVHDSFEVSGLVGPNERFLRTIRHNALDLLKASGRDL